MTHTTNQEGLLEVSSGTGTGALSETITPQHGGRYKVLSVSLHLGVAPAAAGTITVTLNPAAGAAYNILLNTQSLVGVTNYAWTPPTDLYMTGSDSLTVAYANADGRTWGLVVTLDGKS